jgi:hypothetical protein
LCLALFLAEVASLPLVWVVGLGSAILLTRLAHAAGFLRFGSSLSTPAMTATYALELGLSVYLVFRAFHA